jgi:hypothetical protein
MWIKIIIIVQWQSKVTFTIRITTKVISITLDGDQKSSSPFDGTKNLFTIEWSLKLFKIYLQNHADQFW